ncbi:hypothetical protein Hokovirus_1_90 [Hokovirus HKV1]|uniref:Uncharacterized protein n=1 Tax=Hokovirus HKV1 TaxID=1977638 RepID=A0A1V0SEV7_9VIRU|nr:hypothetical protein Hokovirus_1_90 [Hokovirus HKV1]
MDKTTELKKLNELQIQVMHYCLKKSKLYHQNVYELFFSELLCKFSEQDITNTFLYIINDAPLITHLSFSTLQKVINEGILKNAFETTTKGTSYLTNRNNWEKNLFNDIYKDTNIVDRPKYGSINFLNNPSGVSSLIGYGDCYIKYKNSVKYRTTFIHDDTCKMDYHIATFSFCAHIFYYYLKSTKQIIYDLVNVANKRLEYSKLAIDPYIDAQIHGPVLISDIESIHIPKTQNIDANFVYKMELKYPDIQIIFF